MKTTTMSQLRQWKQEKRKFATLTAYDASLPSYLPNRVFRCYWWGIRSV